MQALSDTYDHRSSLPHCRAIAAGCDVGDQGLIRNGLAAVTYDGIYICLLTSGDVVPRAFLEKPLSVQALVSLELATMSNGEDFDEEAPIRALARHTARCAGMRALERTVDFFVELADKANPDWRDSAKVDIPITQLVIADLLGMSAVHLNRTLSKLRLNNLMLLDGARLTIFGRDSSSVRQKAKELERPGG